MKVAIFAPLRQIYSAMILATWYKKSHEQIPAWKDLCKPGKVKGVDQDPKTNAAIYQKYLAAFKKGVYNYIREDEDKYTHQIIRANISAAGLPG